MKALERLQLIEPFWAGITATIFGLVLVLVLRRLLPAEQRHRGRATIFLLALALALRTGATLSLKVGAYTAWALLSFLDILCRSELSS